MDDEIREYTLVRRSPPAAHIGDLFTVYNGASKGRRNWVHFTALESVVDYALLTYGRERLPALIKGIRVYDSWQELVPAVFGITSEEFEDGWHQYLEATPL